MAEDQGGLDKTSASRGETIATPLEAKLRGLLSQNISRRDLLKLGAATVGSAALASVVGVGGEELSEHPLLTKEHLRKLGFSELSTKAPIPNWGRGEHESLTDLLQYLKTPIIQPIRAAEHNAVVNALNNKSLPPQKQAEVDQSFAGYGLYVVLPPQGDHFRKTNSNDFTGHDIILPGDGNVDVLSLVIGNSPMQLFKGPMSGTGRQTIAMQMDNQTLISARTSGIASFDGTPIPVLNGAKNGFLPHELKTMPLVAILPKDKSQVAVTPHSSPSSSPSAPARIP